MDIQLRAWIDLDVPRGMSISELFADCSRAPWDDAPVTPVRSAASGSADLQPEPHSILRLLLLEQLLQSVAEVRIA